MTELFQASVALRAINKAKDLAAAKGLTGTAFVHVFQAAFDYKEPWALKLMADFLAAQPDPDPVPTGMYYPNLPFNAPVPPSYNKLTADDCHVIIKGNGSDQIAARYVQHVKDGGSLPMRVGVEGNGGRVWPGGQYSATNGYSIALPDVQLEIIGLTADAEVHVGWSTKYGSCKHFMLQNIGVRGGSDSFVIRGDKPIGTVIMHGCWWLTGSVKQHASGLHIDNYETLIINGHVHNPETLFREHDFYFKSCIGKKPNAGTWIVNSELKSGRRTGFQRRPQYLKDDKQTLGNASPLGPFVVANNNFDEFGWAQEKDGGGAITVWTAPNDEVYIFGNNGKNLRYSGIVVEAQPWWKNYLNASGFPIKTVHIHGNSMNNPNSSRSLMKLSGVEDIHLYDNDLIGRIVFDSGWSLQQSGILNGEITMHGASALNWLKSQNVKTAKGGTSQSDVSVPDSWFDEHLTVVL